MAANSPKGTQYGWFGVKGALCRALRRGLLLQERLLCPLAFQFVPQPSRLSPSEDFAAASDVEPDLGGKLEPTYDRRKVLVDTHRSG